MFNVGFGFFLLGFFWGVLLNFSGSDRLRVDLIGFYWVLLGFTKVLLDFLECFHVFHGLLPSFFFFTFSSELDWLFNQFDWFQWRFRWFSIIIIVIIITFFFYRVFMDRASSADLNAIDSERRPTVTQRERERERERDRRPATQNPVQPLEIFFDYFVIGHPLIHHHHHRRHNHGHRQ